MRCMMSPTIFESKKAIGRRMSLDKKSEMSEMLIRVVMCSISHERMRLLAVWPSTSTTCATSIITTNERLPVPMPLSTTDCVRNGRIRLSTLAVSIASASCAR